MTAFEIAVPLIALAVAGGGLAYLRWLERRLPRQLARSRKHPAE